MTDIWVCSTCHSINRQRVSRCYKCGGSRDEATGEGSELRVEQAIVNRTVVSYRSAGLRGLVAAILILAVAALGVVLLLSSLDNLGWMRGQLSTVVSGGQLDRTEFLRRMATLVGPGLVRLGLAIAAVLFFGAWLSRVTANIPALGGGVPRTTPTKAFIYPLIPIWNLIKVPGMIQDALYRVDPQAGGFFMLALAWFGLVGSWIISFFAGWVLDLQLESDLRTARTATEQANGLQRWFDLTAAVGVVTELLIAGGAVVLVLVMLRIERRSAARDREIRAAGLAPPGQGGAALADSPGPAPSGESPEPAGALTGEAPAPRYVPVGARAVPSAPEAALALDAEATTELPTFERPLAPEAPLVSDAQATTEMPTFERSPAAEALLAVDTRATAETPTFDGSPVPEAAPAEAAPAFDPQATAELPILDGSPVATDLPEAPEPAQALELAGTEGPQDPTDLVTSAEPADATVAAEPVDTDAAAEPVDIGADAQPADTGADAQPSDTVAAAASAEPPARVGPHLAVVVHGDGRIVATVDADPEQITLEELALVAEALAQAAGTADVTAADEAAAVNGALDMAARTLRDQGVATTTAAFHT
jgi:Domain of unknown function (DUF4328)